MSYERIGLATKTTEPPTQENGVSFSVPYGEDKYNITLGNVEMEILLEVGLEKLLGYQALTGYDFIVDLEPGERGMYLGVRSLNARADFGAGQIVELGVGVVPLTHEVKQHGLLLANKGTHFGIWSFADYKSPPPMKNPIPR
jgi:hypothetical protein